MQLTSPQHDRAAGVLLGQACGDALGVPYEFGTAPLDPATGPRMEGGGLGAYAPGEWSDDTQMAVAVAEVAATGADLTGDDALEQVAAGFLRWHADGPADIGLQTRSILAGRPRHPSDRDHVALRELSADLHRRTGRTAGNGALMRTSVVGLTRLHDRRATAGAARAVAALTHADPAAGDSCVLWSEAVRRAVVDGVLDLTGGLDLLPEDRRAWWAARLEEAETRQPETFVANGWTVTALQAAWSAVRHTRDAAGPAHVVAALHRAIGIGHDTDTVAAIAGGLLGARYGASALPFAWTREVHGWPGLRARGLVHLAARTAAGGRRGALDWPAAARMDDGRQQPLAVALPSDPDVLLGTFADLRRVPELGVDAVVSLCRLGQDEHAPSPVEPRDHAEVWLVDSDDPATHQHLPFVLDEAARTVATLRTEGRRVLLHCVAAHHRTPAVALAYLRTTRVPLAAAVEEVTATLGRAEIGGLLWQEAARP